MCAYSIGDSRNMHQDMLYKQIIYILEVVHLINSTEHRMLNIINGPIDHRKSIEWNTYHWYAVLKGPNHYIVLNQGHAWTLSSGALKG